MTSPRVLRRDGAFAIVAFLFPFLLHVASARAQGPGSGAAPARSPAGGTPSPPVIPDKLTPIPAAQLKVGGELGRRIRATIENSLLNLDVEKDFLKPFREKKTGTPQSMPPTGRLGDGVAQTSSGLLTIDPSSIKGPVADQAVRPDGLACKVQGWGAATWYDGKTSPHFELHLTELPDPDSEGIYFNVPNPLARELMDDELFAGRK